MSFIPITSKYRLESRAAKSLSRMKPTASELGDITSAYRSTAEQREIFMARYDPSRSRWTDRGPYGDVARYNGVWYKRMRGLPVAVPGTSPHNKGLALDISQSSAFHKRMRSEGPRHGWTRPLSNDPVHFLYNAAKDVPRKNLTSIGKIIGVSDPDKVDSAMAGWRKAAKGEKLSVAQRKAVQRLIGVPADGVWGPKSKAAMLASIKKVQKAVGTSADGQWGPASERAYLRATH